MMKTNLILFSRAHGFPVEFEASAIGARRFEALLQSREFPQRAPVRPPLDDGQIRKTPLAGLGQRLPEFRMEDLGKRWIRIGISNPDAAFPPVHGDLAADENQYQTKHDENGSHSVIIRSGSPKLFLSVPMNTSMSSHTDI